MVANQARLQHDIERREADRQIEELEERVERLALACEAMWDLLRRDQNKTDDDLLHWVRHFDAADGQVDGRIQRQPRKCSCGAMVNYRSHSCVYCGAEVGRVSPFA